MGAIKSARHYEKQTKTPRKTRKYIRVFPWRFTFRIALLIAPMPDENLRQATLSPILQP
jgi:hypothetical protein